VWIIGKWQCISPEVIVKGFKKFCISKAVDGTDDNMLWNDSQMAMLGVSVRKLKALTVKMGAVTLIAEGR
jgi:hypothetical protein